MPKLNKKLSLILVGICSMIVAVVVSFLMVKASPSPDYVSDPFTDETKIAEGTEKLEIDTAAGQVKLAECYSPDPSWTKVADTIVRDISNLSNSNATTSKDIYCDDYNCILWTDGAATPTTVCIATDSNVYGNILWSKTDVSGTKTWADSKFSISGGDIGGTHDSSLRCGADNELIGAKNWLARYYSSAAGTFDAMDACKAKGSGWRLPTLLELDSIRDQAKGSPYSRLPNILANDYWSSTEYGSGYAYYLYFDLGSVYLDGNKTNDLYYVRCVRGY